MDLKSPSNPTNPMIATRGFGVQGKPRAGVKFGRYGKIGLIISLICFVIVAGAYLGFFQWQRVLNNQNQALDNKINQLNEQLALKPELREAMSATVEAVSILKNLLRNHILSSSLFKFIADNTLLKTQWSSFDFSAPQLIGQNIESGGLTQLSLQGVTQTYVLVGRQLRVFERLPEVKSVKLSGFSEGEAGVDFSLDIELDPELFLLKLD